MATLRQIFTKMANDVKKYPNIVQLTKTLDEGFKEVAENISGGGGGGDSVSVNGIQTQGTKIGTVTVNDVPTDLYAPSYRMSLVNKTLSFSYNEGNEAHVDGFNLPTGSDVSFTSSNSGGDPVGTLTIDNVSYQMYALHNYSANEHICGKWIDGSLIYEKTYSMEDVTFPYNDWVFTNIDMSYASKIIYCEACSMINAANLAVTATIDPNEHKLAYLNLRNANYGATTSFYLTIRYTKVSI